MYTSSALALTGLDLISALLFQALSQRCLVQKEYLMLSTKSTDVCNAIYYFTETLAPEMADDTADVGKQGDIVKYKLTCQFADSVNPCLSARCTTEM